MIECDAEAARMPVSSGRVAQEIPVPVSVIWTTWRNHKISDEDVQKEFIRSRDRGAVQALNDVRVLIRQSLTLNLETEIRRVQAQLEKNQKGFLPHPKISQFLSQFNSDRYGVDSRKKSLLLVGETQQGKSMRAIGLFKMKHTLKVSCQGLSEGVLPSLSAFDRSRHKAIVWDEIRPDQVLNNREVFQSNQFEQTLQQSSCNQHAFKVWLYHTAQILCANSFDVTAVKDPQDQEWLRKNLETATLGKDQKWYLNA